MPSYSKTIVVGHIGRDPQLKYMPSGAAVCEFSVATTERWKKDGEDCSETEWHNVKCWNKLAENCAQYLKKGSLVLVEGKNKTRSWEKDGVKKYKTEVVAFVVQFLDPKGGRDEPASEKESDPRSGAGSTPPPDDPNSEIPF